MDETIMTLIIEVSSPDENRRRKAANELGDVGGDVATGILIKLLEDQDLGVRLCAQVGLGKIGSPRAVEALLKMLRDENRFISFGVVIALTDSADLESNLPQLTALLDDPQPRTRAYAALIIGNLKNSAQAKAVLGEALYRDDPILIGYVAPCLGLMGEIQHTKRFLELLGSDHSTCRAGAAMALGYLKYAPAVPQLLELIGDKELAFPYGGYGPSHPVENSVIDALSLINTPEAQAAFLEWRRKMIEGVY